MLFDIPIIASFTAPIDINTDPLSLLWLFPLAIAIAVVYKATKVPVMQPRLFLKETITLLISIITFVVVTAVVLYIVQLLFT
jgi:hypothetical protein